MSTDHTCSFWPIFKLASERLEFLKKKKRFCGWALGHKDLDGSLQTLVELSNGLIQRMIAYQRQVWRLLRSGRSQAQIAEELSKHRQSISKAVMKSGAELVMMAEDQITRLLAEPVL